LSEIDPEYTLPQKAAMRAKTAAVAGPARLGALEKTLS
jgi:hypothetical protein